MQKAELEYLNRLADKRFTNLEAINFAANEKKAETMICLK